MSCFIGSHNDRLWNADPINAIDIIGAPVAIDLESSTDILAHHARFLMFKDVEHERMLPGRRLCQRDKKPGTTQHAGEFRSPGI